MSDETTLEVQLVNARIRALAFAEQVRTLGPLTTLDESLVHEGLDQLSATLEELEVAVEELQQQNDELLATRHDLEAERLRYRDLFESAPDGFLVTDRYGIVREANRAAYRLLGRRVLIGKPIMSFVPIGERREARRRLQIATELDPTIERTVAWDLHFAHPDGKPIVASVIITPNHDLSGKIVDWLWSFRDVTALRETEDRIRTLNLNLERRVAERTAELERANRQKDELISRTQQANQRFAFLASASPLLSSSLDDETILNDLVHLSVPTLADWCIARLYDQDRAVNRIAIAHRDPTNESQLREHLAKAVSSLGPEVILSFVQPDHRATLLPPLDAATLEEMGIAGALLPTFQQIGLAASAIVPLVARDRPLGFLWVVITETEGRDPLIDLDLVGQLADRAALAIDNALLYAQAQNAIRSHNMFVSSISHDLKGPLSNAKGYAELLRRRLTSATLLDPEELAKLAARIERNASRAVGMVDELLDVARLRMGSTLNLHRRPTDLVILTQQVVEQLQPTTPRIRLESTVASIVGEWDDVRLERVLVNLVSNALKFSPGDSAIFITVGEEVHPEATFGVVSIRDQGVGIPSADLPHIFDPFHRANNVRGQFQGTGLGLASSRQIVEQHCGTIEVESSEGHGSVFTVRLPLHHGGGGGMTGHMLYTHGEDQTWSS